MTDYEKMSLLCHELTMLGGSVMIGMHADSPNHDATVQSINEELYHICYNVFDLPLDRPNTMFHNLYISPDIEHYWEKGTPQHKFQSEMRERNLISSKKFWGTIKSAITKE